MSAILRMFFLILYHCLLIRDRTLLYKASRILPIATVYAVWTGIGAVDNILVGVFTFKEPTAFRRIFFLFVLIASIIRLKFGSRH